jgi:hypothetical protein
MIFGLFFMAKMSVEEYMNYLAFLDGIALNQIKP